MANSEEKRTKKMVLTDGSAKNGLMHALGRKSVLVRVGKLCLTVDHPYELVEGHLELLKRCQERKFENCVQRRDLNQDHMSVYEVSVSTSGSLLQLYINTMTQTQ